jgi:hypothetical protein
VEGVSKSLARPIKFVFMARIPQKTPLRANFPFQICGRARETEGSKDLDDIVGSMHLHRNYFGQMDR